MSGATIRDAHPDDLDEIVALVHELAAYEHGEEQVTFERDEMARNLFGREPCARVLIAEDDGLIAGFALWFPTFSTWLGRPGIWLEDLFVRPAYRRRGIARALLGALRGRTTGRVEWAVLDWNAAAHDFYRALGASPLDEWTIWRWSPD